MSSIVSPTASLATNDLGNTTEPLSPCSEPSGLSKNGEDSIDSIDDDDDDDDDDDAASLASTVEHEHEPFETFQHKVAQLAEQVFAGAASVTVERMKGGSNNRVVGITVTPPSPKKYTPKWVKSKIQKFFKPLKPESVEKYIVRIPRLDGESLEREVAMLKAIGSQLSLPVPEVTHYDASGDNVLEKPYMIQKRLPGQNLAHIRDQLSVEQWECVAQRVTELIPEVAACESSAAGEISLQNISGSRSEIEVEKFCVPRRGLVVETFAKPKTWPALPQDPLAFLLEQCERWREYQKSQGCYFEHIWDGFAAISVSLHQRGYLDGSFALTHGDLMPYNLLVEVRDSSTVDITGIMDWDTAAFAPQFVAYRAPFWLWVKTDDDSQADTIEESVNEEPLTGPELGAKRIFQQTASEEFAKLAFDPEAILARRMFVHLKDGIFRGWAKTEAELVIREWKELHPEDNIPVEESNDEKDYPDSEDQENRRIGD